MDFSYQLGNVFFPSRIMNASGPFCTYPDELNALGESKSGAIVMKSSTLDARTGNERPKYFENDLGSINSNGLENLGHHEYARLIPTLKRFNKPVVASVAGLTLEDCVEMVKAYDAAGADMIEVNLSCPNIPGKPQVAYDMEYSQKYLEALRPLISQKMSVKLPPYFEIIHRQEMAKLLLANQVDAVTLINSIGNTLIVDPKREQAVIKPKGGMGGLGGKYVKPVALGNAWTFYQELKGKIPLIGVGGIYSGLDAFEFFLCGCEMVQIGTAYKHEGVSIFARIESELSNLLSSKSYARVEDVIGKLKVVETEEYGFGA